MSERKVRFAATALICGALASAVLAAGCSSDVPNEVRYRGDAASALDSDTISDDSDTYRGPTRADGLPLDPLERARTTGARLLDSAERRKREMEAGGG